MLGILAQLGALLLSATVLLAGNGLQTTLLPLRAGIEAFPPFSIGVMGSSYFVGFVGGCLTTAHLVRHVGHIRVFTAMVAAASVVPLIHVLTVEQWVWWVLRAITGFCIAALFLVIESWLNEKAENRTRGTIFSIYTTLTFVAIIGGQVLIPFYDPALFPLFALTSIIISVAAIPIALTSSAQPPLPAEVRLRPIRLVKLSPVGALGCLVVGLSNGAFWALGPVFAADVGLGTTRIAVFIGVTVLGGALSQWPLGRLSDRLDRRVVTTIISILAAVTGIGLFLASRFWNPGILPLAFAFGVFSFPVYALSVAHVNDLITSESFVEVSGGLLLVNGLGSVFGPLAGALAMAMMGPGGLFLYVALVFLLLAAFALMRMRSTPRPAESHSADFVTVADTAVAAPVFDPRTEDAAETDEMPQPEPRPE
ncbi:MFS transporter [Chelativorans sp. AA-79]|uniref:MFS transporter n=1 Tax=Chelativorans sp. AA-79 TaxID=3028735 RepID=UPI0023F7213A|nr:MFS transporter [Chelativorans sp. AA-79]WEX07778.1 MFS transporter [Chelativorans sp. AA-79]